MKKQAVLVQIIFSQKLPKAGIGGKTKGSVLSASRTPVAKWKHSGETSPAELLGTAGWKRGEMTASIGRQQVGVFLVASSLGFKPIPGAT